MPLTEKQKKIDVNKDGKITKEDFDILNADRTGPPKKVGKKIGGSICGRPTGQGYGKARKR